jgi:hypothetical protein
MSASSDISGVCISLERLRALEALEAGLPALLKQNEIEAIARDKKERFRELSTKNKENPKAHCEQVLKKYHENKEEINARRREAYRLKTESRPVAPTSPT